MRQKFLWRTWFERNDWKQQRVKPKIGSFLKLLLVMANICMLDSLKQAKRQARKA